MFDVCENQVLQSYRSTANTCYAIDFVTAETGKRLQQHYLQGSRFSPVLLIRPELHGSSLLNGKVV